MAQRDKSFSRFRLALLAGVLLAGTAPGPPQSTGGGVIGVPEIAQPPGTTRTTQNSAQPDPMDVANALRLRQNREIDRQKQLVRDTDRLLALANQLKAEVATSGADAMTPEMLRQMDEIEKLAKSVKEKMKG
jgi:hypothetical protein